MLVGVASPQAHLGLGMDTNFNTVAALNGAYGSGRLNVDSEQEQQGNGSIDDPQTASR